MGAEKRQRATSYLVIELATGEKQVIVWDTLDICVGRNDNQDIVVADPEVSREHAVFRRRGEACEVEDLKSGLGTIVDGKPIKVHGLKHGNVIRIGTLAIAFGQSADPLPRAKNVRFASELKGFGISALEDRAGRTMLGFDTEDDLRPSASASHSAAPRSVSADGTLEIDGPDFDALDLGAGGVEVRNLDLDLAEDLPALGPSTSAAKTATTAPTVPALDKPVRKPGATLTPAARLDPIAADPTPSEITAERAVTLELRATESSKPPSEAAAPAITTKLVLEVKGPAAQVEAFLEAVRDKRIQLPPIELLVRDI
jgi:predicted component of type VI protein secretion system